MSKKLNEVVTQTTNSNHARTKNAAAGSHSLVSIPDYISFTTKNGFFKRKEPRMIVPTVAKCIDEVIVNAIDHFINCLTKATINHAIGSTSDTRRMTTLVVDVGSNSSIRIKNDGYGIPVEKMPDIDVYVAEFLFLHDLTSTNYNTDKNKITGGTNGMGAKIVSSNSKRFQYEGQDHSKRLMYDVDIGKNGEKNILSISECPKRSDVQFTSIKFLLDWSLTGYKKYKPEVLYPEIYRQVLRRCVLASIYMNNYAKCSVILNNTNITHTLEQVVALSKLSEANEVIIEAPESHYNSEQAMFRKFKLIIGINEYSNKTHIQLSVVNGVEVTSNPIIEHVLKSLYIKIREKLENNAKIKIQYAAFKSRVSAFFIGAICNPEWSSQIKNEFSVKSGYLQSLKFDLKDIPGKYAERLSKYFILDQSKRVVRQVATDKYDTDIHKPARDWGSNKKTNKYLIIVEGDSAATLINRILSQDGDLNMSNCGILKLRGVPMNVYSRMKIENLVGYEDISTGFEDKSIILMDEKCKTNNEINVLLRHAMGIQLNTPVSKILTKMKYTHYIIASDQDLDGWNINGLLLVFFSKFPELFEDGRIIRFQTPIARLVPKNLTKANAKNATEFFSTESLERYLSQYKVPTGTTIKYYKGLGSNESEFAPIFSNNIWKYMFTFHPNTNYLGDLARFYDKENPNLRKEELSTPVRKFTNEELDHLKNKRFPISAFLAMYVKKYQLYNLGRKLLNVVGGQNRVTNKILHALDKMFTGDNPMKVALAGNNVIKYTNYPHGEKSVYDAIFNQTQLFPGSTNLFSVLHGCGEFGTHLGGGKDHADPRYVSVKYNKMFKKLLYRPDDDCILTYQYEENERIDPIYQLPVVPIILFRNYKTTAHGWQIQIWARDVSVTVRALIKLINDEEVNYELPMNTKDIGSTLVSCAVGDVIKVYSRGKFSVSGNVLTITELPFGVWSNVYVDTIKKRAKENENMKLVFNKIDDYSKVDFPSLDIQIVMNEGWQEHIPKFEHEVFSDMELFFRLRTRLRNELNLLSERGSVIEFDSYTDILKYWFNIRKPYYYKRIERRIEIIKNKILVQENICKYLQYFEEWGLSNTKISRDSAKKILAEHGLSRINTKLVEPVSDVKLEHVRKFLLVSKDRSEITEDELIEFDKLRELGIISDYATYEYLNSIRTDQLRDDRLASKLELLEKYRNELGILQEPDAWKEIWLNEIQELKPYMIGSGQ